MQTPQLCHHQVLLSTAHNLRTAHKTQPCAQCATRVLLPPPGKLKPLPAAQSSRKHTKHVLIMFITTLVLCESPAMVSSGMCSSKGRGEGQQQRASAYPIELPDVAQV